MIRIWTLPKHRNDISGVWLLGASLLRCLALGASFLISRCLQAQCVRATQTHLEQLAKGLVVTLLAVPRLTIATEHTVGDVHHPLPALPPRQGRPLLKVDGFQLLSSSSSSSSSSSNKEAASVCLCGCAGWEEQACAPH